MKSAEKEKDNLSKEINAIRIKLNETENRFVAYCNRCKYFVFVVSTHKKTPKITSETLLFCTL